VCVYIYIYIVIIIILNLLSYIKNIYSFTIFNYQRWWYT